MIQSIKAELEELWLNSVVPDVLLVDSKTLGDVYMDGKVKIHTSIEEEFEVQKVIVTDAIDGFKFMKYA